MADMRAIVTMGWYSQLDNWGWSAYKAQLIASYGFILGRTPWTGDEGDTSGFAVDAAPDTGWAQDAAPADAFTTDSAPSDGWQRDDARDPQTWERH